MQVYSDTTSALRAVLLQFVHGYCYWITFTIERAKLPALDEKFRQNYDTNAPAHRRADRRKKSLQNRRADPQKESLPNAFACAMPTGLTGGKELTTTVQVVLMTDQRQNSFPQNSPFNREKWREDLPQLSGFVLAHDKDESGKKAAVWTWRIQKREAGLLANYLSKLIHEGSSAEIREWAESLPKIYPLFSGVRRQIKLMLRGGKKLYELRGRGVWPGPDHERMATVGAFRKGKTL